MFQTFEKKRVKQDGGSLNNESNVFPLGFVIALFLLWLSKWVSLGIGVFSVASLGDLPFLSFTLFSSLVACRFLGKRKYFPFFLIFFCLSAFLFFWYLLDSAVYLSTTYHLSVDEIIRFSSEAEVLLPFVDWWVVAGCIVVAVFALWCQHLSRWFLGVALVTSVTTIVLSPLVFTLTDHRGKEAGLWLSGFYERLIPSGEDPGRFSDTQVALALKRYKSPFVSLPNEEPNIILLIVESLSTHFFAPKSKGGLELENLKQLKGEGTYFTNFFANHRYSAGGIISLFHGVPPYPYPNARRSIHKSFAKQETVLKDFKDKGYYTEIIWPIDPSHYNFEAWGAVAGFDHVRTIVSDSTLLAQDKEHFHPTSDRSLLNRLLGRVEELSGKDGRYFLSLETRSTHRPYFHPEGGEHTFQALWEYTDKQIGEFVTRLEELSYFDDGVLLILGDHRVFQLAKQSELKELGDSSPARVPFLALGHGFSRGYTDSRLLQQADLFRKLSLLPRKNEPLSRWVAFVDRWLSFGEEKARDGNVIFFIEGTPLTKGYRGSVFGDSFRWLSKPPAFSDEIRREVTTKRAALQHFSDLKTKRCTSEDFELLPGEIGSQEQVFNGGAGVEFSVGERSEVLPVIDIADLSSFDKETQKPFIFRGYVRVEEAGNYWFRVKTDRETCLVVGRGGLNILYQPSAVHENEERSTRRVDPYFDGQVSLQPGVYPFVIRVNPGGTMAKELRSETSFVEFLWDTPTTDSYETIPEGVLFLPLRAIGRE